jgi:DNA mismatch repair protein MutL
MNVKFFDDREIFSTVSRAVSNHLGSLKLNESKENYSYDISDDSIKYVVEEKRTVYSVNIDNLFETEEIQNESVNEFKIIGQIFDSVILVEIDSEVYFIDQHIAHERVLYEKFISEAEKTSIKIKLVEPVVIEVLEEDKEIIIKNIKNFEKIGFDLEDFGGNFVSVLSVPTSIVHKNIENEFMELINEFHKNKNENLLDSLSITMACKTAIKAGEKLTDYEMKKVVSELFQTKNPFTCPHGRPIIYKMSKEEIFKKFHRL